MGKFLALQHVYDHNRVRVLDGYYQNPTNADDWIEAHNVDLYEGEIVKAGSKVEMNLAMWRVKRAVKNNVLVPLSDNTDYHFDLEQVFGHDMIDHFGGLAAPIADILREHGVYTLEQVAEEKPGIVPFTPAATEPARIGMRKLLGSFCENDERQINLWIEAAKAALKPKPILQAVERPVPIVSPSVTDTEGVKDNE